MPAACWHRILAPHRALGQHTFRHPVRRDLHFGPIRPKLAVRLQEHVAKSRSIVDKLQRKPVEALFSELLIGWAQRVGVPAHRGLDPSWRDYALHQTVLRYASLPARVVRNRHPADAGRRPDLPGTALLPGDRWELAAVKALWVAGFGPESTCTKGHVRACPAGDAAPARAHTGRAGTLPSSHTRPWRSSACGLRRERGSLTHREAWCCLGHARGAIRSTAARRLCVHSTARSS